MEGIAFLLLLAAAIYIYAKYFNHDPDDLDRRGHPKIRRRKKGKKRHRLY